LSKRAIVAGLLIIFGLGLMLLSFVNIQPGFAQDDDTRLTQARQGAVIYAQYCAACHGAQGEAIGTGPAFASIAQFDPAFAKGRIINGYDSDITDEVSMPGYGEEADGPLSEAEIELVLAYMATWNDETLETPALPKPNLQPGPKENTGTGDSVHGAEIYAYSCLGCHGRDGQGVNNLKNFPSFTITANTIRLVATGDGHGNLPAFAESNGGPLSEQDLTDLGAYLNTIEAESEDDNPEGVNILIIVFGLAALLLVGGAYMASNRPPNGV
jgi:cytochrome c oxidase cbb3-type subunit 3/ubiquinol-cytochrome c reductase cytochrome c subunit